MTRTLFSGLVVSGLTACAGAAWGAPAAQPRPDHAGTWRHDFQARFAVQQGPPHHSLQDPIVAPGEATVLNAKFAYGTVSKDLEDEDVVAFVKDRGRWFLLATARTDGDGRVSIPISGDKLTSPGEYPLRIVVQGDESYASGAIWVLERGAALAVFDLDGTLTTDLGEAFEAVLLGREPECRVDAPRLVQRWADHDVIPLYLTGRPHMMAQATRLWLERQGFPHGPLRTGDRLLEGTGDAVIEFKSNTLRDLTTRISVRFAAAYGDTETDLCAYATGGVRPDVTHLLGEHGGEACAGYPASRAIADYATHLRDLDL